MLLCYYNKTLFTQQLDAGVKSRLQSEMDEKVRKLAQETSLRKNIEKVNVVSNLATANYIYVIVL